MPPPDLVETMDELRRNCANVPYHWEIAPDYMRAIVARANNFVVFGEPRFFAPSRYIGYKNITPASHEASRDGTLTGSGTSARLRRLLGPDRRDKGLEAALRSQIPTLNEKQHTFWLLDDVFTESVVRSLEGTTRSVVQTVRERDPDLRAACLAQHGVACWVCDFDFERVYGNLGTGFIHVRHLYPLAAGARQTGVNDLIPVCPNCHAMLHRAGQDPGDWNGLRDLVRRRR